MTFQFDEQKNEWKTDLYNWCFGYAGAKKPSKKTAFEYLMRYVEGLEERPNEEIYILLREILCFFQPDHAKKVGNPFQFVSRACSKSDIRSHFRRMYWFKTGDLIATDGHRMHHVSGIKGPSDMKYDGCFVTPEGQFLHDSKNLEIEIEGNSVFQKGFSYFEEIIPKDEDLIDSRMMELSTLDALPPDKFDNSFRYMVDGYKYLQSFLEDGFNRHGKGMCYRVSGKKWHKMLVLRTTDGVGQVYNAYVMSRNF